MMIATLNVIGGGHNCCQDSILVKETANFIYGGVFDGCSTGIDSQWASKTIASLFARHDLVTNDLAIHDVRDTLANMKDVMGYTDLHFLSTCVLFCYHKRFKQLQVRIFGDGFYFINDIEYRVEQNNAPDYLGYHLDENYSDFNNYMEKYPVKIYDDVVKFQICSDGIDSIIRSQFADETQLDPLKMLLHPPTAPNYLQRQWNILKNNKFTLNDDLSIISYVQD